jgi:ariadne-1
MVRLEELRPEMLTKMKDVSEILNVPVEATALLLNQFAWSRDALLEQYMDRSDQILQKAGVFCRCTVGANTSTSGQSRMGTRSTSSTLSCSICYDDDLEASEMYRMPCQHAFCITCWKDYLHNALYESGLGPSCVFSTECPHTDCHEKVTEAEFSTLFKSSNDAMNIDNANDGNKSKKKLHPDLTQYRNFLLRAYVETNPLTQGCPAPGCDRVASALSEVALEEQQGVVACDNVALHSQTSSMPFYFCVYCGHNEAHAPVACKQLQMWQTKCRNESETANWILANTKSCPSCASRIEKNQGMFRPYCHWAAFSLLTVFARVAS